MPKVTDALPLPGELVIPRVSAGVSAYGDPKAAQALAHIKAGTLGFVVSTNVTTGWTYVLWSIPGVVGWSADGWLRRIGQRG